MRRLYLDPLLADVPDISAFPLREVPFLHVCFFIVQGGRGPTYLLIRVTAFGAVDL